MATRAEAMKAGLPATFFIGTIRLYKHVVSPWLRPACRFYPSCSEYAIEAIARHGLLGGLTRSLRRLSRCHPFQAGGVDLVD